MFIFYLINRLVPKSKRQICLSSFPDYDDQVRALIVGILKLSARYQIVILNDRAMLAPTWAIHQQIKHYKKRSIMGMWAYMRSKYVFFTHGCFSGAKTVPAQVCVNVWHGMPIKKIGRYLDENHPTSNGDYIIATSKFFAEKVGYAFRMRDEQVLVTGLPRNDVLLEKGNPSLRKELCGKQKMVVWLPTYRKSVVGEIRMDGEQEQNVFNMPDLDMEVLDKMLGKMGVTAIVKPHPMAMAHAGSEPLAGCSNIKLIDETWLLEHDTTLYELLALSDALITDVSSVLIDYLVTDKPIICHFPDREMYSNSRGLIWDFKPDEYGIPVVDTQKELLQTIENVVSKGAFEKKKLKRLKTLSHEVESGFAKVLLDWVGKDFD